MHKKHRHKIRKKGMAPGTLIYTGDREVRPSDVLHIRYGEEAYVEMPGFDKGRMNRHQGVDWIDVRGLTDVKLVEEIGLHYNIHLLALEDILDTHQRPKLEEYDVGIFFIIHNLKFLPETFELCSEQISAVLLKNALLSFQEDPDDTFFSIRVRANEGLGRLRKKGADYLAYCLLDTVVDGYYYILDDLETKIHELEEELHIKGDFLQAKGRLLTLKKIENEFRFRVAPLREAAARFYRTDSPVMDETNRLYFRDLLDHVAGILDAIDNQKSALSNIEALYHAEAANRLNNVMRLLTVISTIFIPLSFIAGIYGMNFDNMPELHWHSGYYFILGFMFMAMIGMLAYFRKKHWI